MTRSARWRWSKRVTNPANSHQLRFRQYDHHRLAPAFLEIRCAGIRLDRRIDEDASLRLHARRSRNGSETERLRWMHRGPGPANARRDAVAAGISRTEFFH